MMKTSILLALFTILALTSCKKKYDWYCSCSINLAAYDELIYQELTESLAKGECTTRKDYLLESTLVNSVDCDLINLGKSK